MKKKNMDLQLFAEDAASTGTTGTAVNPPATETAVNPPATEAAEVPGGDGQAAPEEGQEESFEDLIKTKYKKDFDSRVQAIVKSRVKDARKNAKQMEERMGKMQPVMELFGRKYGISTENLTDEAIEQIAGRILEDNSFYEDEAMQRGLDVETYKAMQRMERENAALKKFQQDTQANQETQRKFGEIARQAEDLKSLYPEFDLQQEMENPEFQRLTWGAGVPLQTAYEVIHRDELLPAAMQYTAQRTAEKISNSIQSGIKRPAEGGISDQSASLTGGKRPRDWSKEEREAIRNRVRSGERVVF